MTVTKLTTHSGRVFYTKESISLGGLNELVARMGWGTIYHLEHVDMTDAEYAAIPADPVADAMFGEAP